MSWKAVVFAGAMLGSAACMPAAAYQPGAAALARTNDCAITNPNLKYFGYFTADYGFWSQPSLVTVEKIIEELGNVSVHLYAPGHRRAPDEVLIPQSVYDSARNHKFKLLIAVDHALFDNYPDETPPITSPRLRRDWNLRWNDIKQTIPGKPPAIAT